MGCVHRLRWGRTEQNCPEAAWCVLQSESCSERACCRGHDRRLFLRGNDHPEPVAAAWSVEWLRRDGTASARRLGRFRRTTSGWSAASWNREASWSNPWTSTTLPPSPGPLPAPTRCSTCGGCWTAPASPASSGAALSRITARESTVWTSARPPAAGSGSPTDRATRSTRSRPMRSPSCWPPRAALRIAAPRGGRSRRSRRRGMC